MEGLPSAGAAAGAAGATGATGAAATQTEPSPESSPLVSSETSPETGPNQDKGIFPFSSSEAQQEYEMKYGLYPDINDPEFTQKLLAKREFAENKYPPLTEASINPCNSNQEFEISPVQRFVSRFLAPSTPYNSALLYHGVGVGKTCAAVLTGEAFLEKYPRRQVIIVAPRNIQSGFLRTIFPIDSIKYGRYSNEPNTLDGCTGNTYLKLADCEFVREKSIIQARVNKIISQRYKIYGYNRFYNVINNMLKTVSKARKDPQRILEEENSVLRKYFSGRLLIIDEAHNLRDIPTERIGVADATNVGSEPISEEEAQEAPGGQNEMAERAEGKLLTPVLKRLLEQAQGSKLMLLTATPMYNSYLEITFLFDLLLLNDKKKKFPLAELIFQRDGTLKPDGEALLGKLASVYVSFMRGENPLSFPLRLFPTDENRLELWPTRSPALDGEPRASAEEKARMLELPFIGCNIQPASLATYLRLARRVIESSGLGLAASDVLIQAGNWLFPTGNPDEPFAIRESGFAQAFTESTAGSLAVFEANGEEDDKAAWLRSDQIAAFSPKTAFLLQHIQTGEGVSFIYSRFVKSGALSIALALEANGYTPWGRASGLLVDGNQMEEGRQCALCTRREREHAGADHGFKPAYYGLLTGSAEYSPNNAGLIAAARSDANKDGTVIKVVVGSQVASEGIDLRFVREIYVFDSWFHLNKLEQVLGRGIRMCSHALLPESKRNTTIYLLVVKYPDTEKPKETMDMYQYRMGMRKAFRMGEVSRIIKRYALDCNLNHDAIYLRDLSALTNQVNAQREAIPRVERRDRDFTSICDWMKCEYTCAVPLDIRLDATDESTYDDFAARYHESQIKNIVRRLFAEKSFFDTGELEAIFIDRLKIPRTALVYALTGIVGKKNFVVDLRTEGEKGYIVYRNGYYLLQPLDIPYTGIPIAMRIGDFPVKRDEYGPEMKKPVPREMTMAPAAASASAATAAATAIPEPRDMEDAWNFWKAILLWAAQIRAGKASTSELPPTILGGIMAKRDLGEADKKVFEDTLKIVLWFYNHVGADPEKLDLLSVVLPELIWDRFFSSLEQYHIFRKSGGVANPVWSEQRLQDEDDIVFRWLDPRTGRMVYMCDDKKCTELQTTYYEKEVDLLRNIRADTRNTAEIYGTINAKEGKFVFKTNKPVQPNKKPDRGSECAILSSRFHLTRVAEIVALGRRLLGIDLKIDEKTLAEQRITNLDACPLMEIILRFLDKKIPASGKTINWFYRPIATFKTGHPQKIRK